jgi:pimeloyl-ACP methyl ester carboxylesterase
LKKQRLVALTGAALGLAGLVAEHVAVQRRRRDDPEAAEAWYQRDGTRSRWLELADGARLYVEELGPQNSKGAVFVHGSTLRTDVWHYQMRGVRGHHLIFYDLRGHGLSQPKGEAPFSIATLAEDLQRVVGDCGLEEVVIVGHSVGGMLALELCRARPELLGSTIKGLVLLNTTYRPAMETIMGGAAIARFERVARRPLDFIGRQSVRIDALRGIVRPSDAVFWGVALAAFGPGASARQIDLTYDMVAGTPADVIFDLIKCYRDFDVEGALEEITIPVLVVAGTHDRLTVPSASEYLAERLPKAQFELLEGCGHMSMLERHQAVNAMIESFLKDTLESPPAGGGKSSR